MGRAYGDLSLLFPWLTIGRCNWFILPRGKCFWGMPGDDSGMPVALETGVGRFLFGVAGLFIAECAVFC